MTLPRRIFVADVGSTKQGNFAWVWADAARPALLHAGGSSIAALADALASALNEGCAVALGFESPLFLPVPDDDAKLSSGRTGDGNRSCFAPAGVSVTLLGLHQLAWVLSRVRRGCEAGVPLTLDWRRWPPDEPVFLLFEAFVSGSAHANPKDDGAHLRDAATATAYFLEHERDLSAINAATTERPLSLAGFAAVWAGRLEGDESLHQPTLVVKPEVVWTGEWV